ncbi:MAG TPA: peptidoglycan-binding domain-containing protein [Candidatus Limnocylindrales bacterium]|nr:peptidoglycan-binding domain-containing protein [Candidatus Limnocylindrales bacterium]
MRSYGILLLGILFLSSLGSVPFVEARTSQVTVVKVKKAPRYSRATIAKAQALLKAQGYYTGPINGIMTPATRAALKSYQRRHYLTVTGYLNKETIRSMKLDLRS